MLCSVPAIPLVVMVVVTDHASRRVHTEHGYEWEGVGVSMVSTHRPCIPYWRRAGSKLWAGTRDFLNNYIMGSVFLCEALVSC